MPYRKVDGHKLASVLSERYGLSLVTPNFLQQLEKVQARPSTEEGGFVNLVMQRESPSLEFTGGRFPTGRASFIDIINLSFNEEIILAEVGGLTEVAETLIAETFEAIWRASGAARSWQSKEVQDNVQMKSFGTHTKVNLGFSPMKLFSKNIEEYLRESIKEYGPSMIAVSKYDNFAPSHNVHAVLSLDELHFRVNVFNVVTGRAQSSIVRFSIVTKDEQGRGIIDVTSELPFDRHVAFIKGFIEKAKV